MPISNRAEMDDKKEVASTCHLFFYTDYTSKLLLGDIIDFQIV